VVGEQGQDVPPGQVGELILGGPHVCSGDWRQPEVTAAVYRAGWWHTGDLVHCDPERYYCIVGRKKDLFISGGENVSPAEIEGVLATHPGVLEVAVISRPDPRRGEVGLAIVVPQAVSFVLELPRNAMGKVRKAQLVEEFGQNRPRP
jgi:fatty-acyl-CoA synthase